MGVGIMAVTANQHDIDAFLYRLYQDVAVAAISISCRKKLGLYSQDSFIYGDSYMPSLYEIISEVKPQPGEVFYDLGSGGGRVVLFAALSFPFAKAVGVELLNDLDAVARQQLNLMYKKLPAMVGFDPGKIGNIQFVNGDFTKTEVSDADIIYVASTCYEAKLMHKLADFLAEQVKVGTRIITCTQSLPANGFKINTTKVYAMEWGLVTVFFQEKI